MSMMQQIMSNAMANPDVLIIGAVIGALFGRFVIGRNNNGLGGGGF